MTQPSNNPPVRQLHLQLLTRTSAPSTDADSTDENTSSLTYTWSFGTQGTATGPLPTKTFTAPGTFPVTLTVKDEWQVSNTSAAQNVTITEPSGNVAPVPTFAQSCQGLTCSVSSAGYGRPEHRGHHRLLLELGRRHGAQHGRLARGPRLRRGRHLHDHAHDHGRLGARQPRPPGA